MESQEPGRRSLWTDQRQQVVSQEICCLLEGRRISYPWMGETTRCL